MSRHARTECVPCLWRVTPRSGWCITQEWGLKENVRVTLIIKRQVIHEVIVMCRDAIVLSKCQKTEHMRDECIKLMVL